MREIKFRGKVKWPEGTWPMGCSGTDGEWVYGDLHLQSSFTHIHQGEKRFIVDPDTVGQYTGMKDRNGREIYEGDILRSDTYPFSCMEDGVKDNYYAEVYWDGELFGFYFVVWKRPGSYVRGISSGIAHELCEMPECEVAGNIYENKELIDDGE